MDNPEPSCNQCFGVYLFPILREESSVKKFIKNLLIFISLILCCSIAIITFHCNIVGSQYEYNYQASLIDKVYRLTSITQPKIILVGNSSLSFGICSEEIEEALGMPVINLGLHGGMGNAFHEQIVKLNIGKDDIVVVCHSSFSDTDEILDPSLAWITYDYHAELLPIIREKDFKKMLPAYPDYIKTSFSLWLSGSGNADPGGSYSRSAFNEYGDIVRRPENPQIDKDALFRENPVLPPEINDICVSRLNHLNRFVNEQGAAMVIAGYPIGYGKYAEFSEDDFLEFQSRLAAVMDCEIISDYTDYFYPYDYFYDTTLHLTKEGAQARTAQLISDLESWLNRIH